jgi:cytochrome c553
MIKILILTFFTLFSQNYIASAEDTQSYDKEIQIQRGKQLVNEGRCNDCHTPSIETSEGIMPDNKRTLSGHPSDSEIPEIPAVDVNSEEWIEFLSTLDSTVWVGEWGMSFSANITPDPDTGIGKWDENVFVEIMKSGRHVNLQRGIKPPMPWQDYAKLSDQDLKSIFAYLSTIQPINNPVPKPVPLPKKANK